MEISKKAGKTESFLIKSPPQAENFEDFRAFLGRKHVQNALRKVFLIQKRFQNASKFSACGGHIIIKARLVNAPIFFAPAAAKIIVLLSFMLVYRASLDNQKTLNFARCTSAGAKKYFRRICY